MTTPILTTPLQTTPKTLLLTSPTTPLGLALTTAFHRASWLPLPLSTSPDLTSTSLIIHCAAPSTTLHPTPSAAPDLAATSALAAAAAATGTPLIYISSASVFSGAPGEAPYDVDAEPGPLSEFGRGMLGGERAVADAYAAAAAAAAEGKEEGKGKGGQGKLVILRVPTQLYGHGASAMHELVEMVRGAQTAAEGEVRVDGWERGWPTCVEDVGRVVVDIATRLVADEEVPPVLHFGADAAWTEYEVCEMIAGMLRLRMRGVERDVPPEGEDGEGGRPYDRQLSTRALRELGVEVHTQDFKGWWRWELNAVRR